MPEIQNCAVKAWVIAVDMGYGHQRAAHALRDIAFERVITADNRSVVSTRKRWEWQRARRGDLRIGLSAGA
jgi:hypothetical protein